MCFLPIDFVRAIQKENETGPDKIIYEDEFIIVERKNNQIVTTGKPIRLPITWG